MPDQAGYVHDTNGCVQFASAKGYIQVPLIFIQIVETKDYSRSLGTDTNVDTAMTAAV